MATPDSVIGSDEYKTQDDWIVGIDSTMGETASSKYTPISIFKVPKSISDIMPEAYSPQLIGLGPYHYFRSDIFRTGCPYKITAANKAIENFQLDSFAQLVDGLKQQFQEINACYFGTLGLQEDTLARVMAVDSLFLLELLHILDHYYLEDDSPWHLTQSLNNPMFRNAIVKDVMMLENQIPLFVLSQTFSTSSKACKSLSQLLVSFCDARCPIVLDRSPDAKVDHELEHKHILDLMYGAITRELNTKPKDKGTDVSPNNECCRSCPAVIKKTLNSLINLFRLALRYCVKLPCKKLTDCVQLVLQQFGISFNTEKNVLIPSVEDLERAGVKFTNSVGGIKSIDFDSENQKFSIPTIKLNPTSEVVMRNLLAYETMTQKLFCPLNRYAELMNAMVDTIKDVRLLKRAKIIQSSLKDVEVLEILNGMGKQMTAKDKNIDKAIHYANEYYKRATTVRLGRFMKKYVYYYWKILAFLASVFLLLLTTLQTFCGFYDCPKIN